MDPELKRRIEEFVRAVVRDMSSDYPTSTVPVSQVETLVTDEFECQYLPLHRVKFTPALYDEVYGEGGGKLAPFYRVYAVGNTPLDAIISLGAKMNWGPIVVDRNETPNVFTAPHSWYYRISVGVGGTSIRIGGRYLEGGVIIDWWV